MGWARIDDGFDDHPKVLALLDHDDGAAAIGLWTLCLAWAHRNTRKKDKTPGLIPAGLPRRYLGQPGRDAAGLLVQTGLWEAAEDGGWYIHDFGNYLPTAETSAARAEAGKRGAEKRWAGHTSTPKQPDGKLPSADSNLPEPCHDAASKPVASDGSRAPARRAISKEIAPVPVPVPTSSGADEPRHRDPSGNVGDVVAAFVDGATANGQPAPASKLRARVGKDARSLLADGFDLETLIDSARNMGAGEWNDLAVQVRKDAAAANGRASPANRPAQPPVPVRDEWKYNRS
jgi:hypothetical protein